ALSHSDVIKFNILYNDKELECFISGLKGAAKIEKSCNKFYFTGETLSLVLEGCDVEVLSSLKKFDYWENKFIEDPSFWKGDNELLASITHEDLVMVDMSYFEGMVESLNLYDLPDSV
ncbi:hypothetical protein, partial [Phaeodactylibacter luteus]|uniref:hypothetical protein n=1 Tax=Phaeodactylibacter luteus TaxID=1564516 RepID=UPI00147947BA